MNRGQVSVSIEACMIVSRGADLVNVGKLLEERIQVYLGLQTVPSDGYGCQNDGQVMGTVDPSTVHQVWKAEPQRGQGQP